MKVAVAGLCLILAAPAARAQTRAEEPPKVLQDCLKSQSPQSRLESCSRAARRMGIEPQHKARAQVARGLAYLSLDKRDLALAEFDAAVRSDPADWRAANQACWHRAVDGRELDKALALCSEAIRLCKGEPSCLPKIHDSRALVQLKRDRPAEAFEDYETAMRLKAGPHYQYGRGIAAIRLGRVPEGKADLTAAIRLDPAVPGAFVTYGIRP